VKIYRDVIFAVAFCDENEQSALATIQRGYGDGESSDGECEQTTTSNSNLQEIIEQIKIAYDGHEELEDMVNDLQGESYYDYWARKMCDEDFGINKKLAKELFEIELSNAEDSRDYLNMAEYFASEEYLGETSRADELYTKALELAEDFDDKKSIADNILKNMDRGWAIGIYKEIESEIKELSEYNGLIRSIKEDLEDEQWASNLIARAKEELLGADDMFEFAGYSSEIIELGETIANENEEEAKEIFELVKKYEGVTDLLDGARKVSEIYGESEYTSEYQNEAVERAIEFVEDGYYCDIFSFILDELEDNERASEFKEQYDEQMRSDAKEYGGCEDLYASESIDLDEIDFDDYEDDSIILEVQTGFVFKEVEEIEDDEEKVEVAQEKIGEFLSDLSDKFSGYVGDTILLREYDEDTLYSYEEGISKVSFDSCSIYIVLSKSLPKEIINAALLEMYDYEFGANVYDIESGDTYAQTYDCGEYDTGYFESGSTEYYLNNHIEQFNQAKEKLLG
jgi:hypothetical protein